MKYCPTCETRYDEDILRFCMKDGTPLVDEAEPTFIEMPSEDIAAAPPADDSPEEVTVIRRNVPVPAPPPANVIDDDDDDFAATPPPRSAERIVVPTYEQQRQEEQARVRATQYNAPPQRTNTALIVILTIIGTVGVLTVVGAAIYFLATGNKNGNANLNANLANANTNLNTNLGIDANFNFPQNVTVPNINTNANLRSPTPTPTPRPSPSPSPSVSPTPDDDDSPGDNVNGRPRVSPTPLPTPRTTSTPLPANRPPVNGGVLNSRAVSLPVPFYPTFARNAGASGQVTVQVFVDERGNVISAKALTGHPLLRGAAEQAARNSKIQPTRLGDIPVKTTGVLLYNFRNN
jgi:TonB family protein